MSKYTSLRCYGIFLRQFKKPFPCSFCGKHVPAISYEKHCIAEKHDINVKINCVWCRGKVSWLNREKHLNMQHIKECTKMFLRKISTPTINSSNYSSHPSLLYSNNEFTTTTNNIISTIPSNNIPNVTAETASTLDFDSKRIDDLHRKCNAKDFFGVLEKIQQQQCNNHKDFLPLLSKLKFNIDESFIFKIPDPPTKSMQENILKFQDEDINKAVYYLKYFLGKVHESSDDEELASDLIDLDLTENWYHLIIKRAAFESFLEAMRKYDHGHTRILPFYTWCDGSNFEHYQYRHHIHMIVASRKEGKHFFEHVWSKIKPSNKPLTCPNYQCKQYKPLSTPLHFINVIHYVSRPESSCMGNFFNNNNNNKKKKKTTAIQKKKNIVFMTPTKARHFYIATPLPEISKYCLASQYDTGIVELLQNMYQNFEPDYDLDGVIKIDEQWHIPIKNFPHLILDLTLPIHPDFIAVEDDNDDSTTTTTNAYLPLTKLKTVYFKLRNPHLHDPPPHTEFKFLRMIENFNILLRPRVQKRLKSINQSVERANRIKYAEMEALFTKISQFETEFKSKNLEIEEALHHKIADATTKIEALHHKIAQSQNSVVEVFRKEIESLNKIAETRDVELQSKNAKLESKNTEINVLKMMIQVEKLKSQNHQQQQFNSKVSTNMESLKKQIEDSKNKIDDNDSKSNPNDPNKLKRRHSCSSICDPKRIKIFNNNFYNLVSNVNNN